MIFYRKIDKIQAISFDLDDTLYDNHPYIMAAESKLKGFLQQHFPRTKTCHENFWNDTKKRVLKLQPELRLDMGLLRHHTLRAGLSECGYQGAQLEEGVQQSFRHFYFHRSDFKVDEIICSLLSELAQRLPLVAITNGNVNLQQIGISEYFQFSLHANLTQAMKPHSGMFKLACERLKLSPGQILHVGDSLINDVLGGQKAGLQTAWYAHNRTMRLNTELTSLLPDIELHSLDELKLLL